MFVLTSRISRPKGIDGELKIARVLLNRVNGHFADVKGELDLRSRPGIGSHQQNDRRDDKVNDSNDCGPPNGAY